MAKVTQNRAGDTDKGGFIPVISARDQVVVFLESYLPTYPLPSSSFLISFFLATLKFKLVI
jgi:hypothetical protein